MVEVADTPGETVAGESAVAASVKPGVVFAETIRVTVAIWFGNPVDVPVTVTVDVPAGVLPVVEIKRVTGPAVTGLVGVNPQAAPDGRPVQARPTVPLKPPCAATARL